MYNEYIIERIYMTDLQKEVLQVIENHGSFIIDEDDNTYDDAINELLEQGIIRWSVSMDDAVVLA